MLLWLSFALLSALGQSITSLFSKYLVSRIPKLMIFFGTYVSASAILFCTSFIKGTPSIGDKFFIAIFITAFLNIIAYFSLLRAYELADLTTVFPMILLTPIFMIGTSYLILGEVPSWGGILGIILTIVGLFIIIKGSTRDSSKGQLNNKKGIFYGILVSFLFSISANFDKMAVLNSDGFFAGASFTALMCLGMLPFLFSGRIKIIKELKVNKRNLNIAIVGGLIVAATILFHNLALSKGLAAYTVLIKRTSVLFGVVFGIIFFKEKNFLPKFIGSAIAILGIAIILLF